MRRPFVGVLAATSRAVAAFYRHSRALKPALARTGPHSPALTEIMLSAPSARRLNPIRSVRNDEAYVVDGSPDVQQHREPIPTFATSRAELKTTQGVECAR